MEMSIKEMMEAGAHFGHQTSQWNPRMKPYIFGARNGIHIIDLQKTLDCFRQAAEFVTKTVAEGGEILFVGTKRQAGPIVEDEARRCRMFYVNKRWLGGTLTNFKTIKASIDRLKNLEKKMADGSLEALTKKEKRGIEKEIGDLTQSLGGIKEMLRFPAAIFLIDAHREYIALSEAIRIKIPVIALVDTNSNPRGVDYLIPANDDAIKSIRLFCHQIADACLEGLNQREMVLRQRREGEESQEPLQRENVIGAKGRAYVSKPEAYEAEGVTEYSAEEALKEKKDSEV